MNLRAFADANWDSCPNTCKSTFGWCVYLGRSLISQKCKKQGRISKSSTEAEYRAVSEVEWLHGLITELEFSQSTPTLLHGDNMSAIKIIENPFFYERTEYIELNCHYTCDAYDWQLISLPYVPLQIKLLISL